MAFNKTLLVYRLFNSFRNSTQPKTRFSLLPNPISHSCKYDSMPTFYNSNSSAFLFDPHTNVNKSIDHLRGSNRERVAPDGLLVGREKFESVKIDSISVGDARKLLKVSHLETVKSKVKLISKTCVSYSDLVELCIDCVNGLSVTQGRELARMLDESGSVIVLGNLVFLHPEQVMSAINSWIILSATGFENPRLRKELEEMEEKKKEIDQKADKMAKRELWFGLSFFLLQTLGLMRLTFWELSWDVMEPICFFLTSTYFIGGYAFFLRTSKDPSFEGFYHCRFTKKQQQLMKMKNFDVDRFHNLKKVCASSSNHEEEA